MAQDAVTAETLIAKLRFQLARYRRAEFGRSSEKPASEQEQLELTIEALEADQAERLAASPASGRSDRDRHRGTEAGSAAPTGPPAARKPPASSAPSLSPLWP